MTEELQADRASDRRIAERLGNQVLCVGKDFGTEEYAIFKGYDRYPLPHYTTSLDAAWSLFDNSDEMMDMRIAEYGREYIVAYTPKVEMFSGAANTIALAVCRAWWAWMDREEA